MFYKGKEKVIKLFDYITTVSKAKYVVKHRKGHKILTPKQMREILPIALAQLKTDKTSENLLIEIRQIIYFLYRAK